MPFAEYKIKDFFSNDKILNQYFHEIAIFFLIIPPITQMPPHFIKQLYTLTTPSTSHRSRVRSEICKI